MSEHRRDQLLRLLMARREAAPSPASSDIAIIGLAGRYPGAGADGATEMGGGLIDSLAALDAFWANIRQGRDAIGEIPADRWDCHDPAFFEADKAAAVASGRSYARWGGFLDGGIDRFDARLFGVSPREAALIDPQERLFLEVAWHAVEDAGYRRDRLAGRRIGVFAGVMFGQYQMLPSADGVPNSSFGAIANRVSHVFDWRGPSLTVDTMCSSALTALQLACDALARGELEMALAGGVNLIVHPTKYVFLSQGRFMATDGRCRAFGEGGDGYVPGEGAGAVLLKPLAKAVADGDLIWGVIKGGALNHGGRSAGSGFTVPSPLSQAAVAADALATARVDPASIGYVEAHGTGTSLGDPVEIAGLTKAYGARGPLPVGSVKGNIGHLESAAGIASLTKVLLQMRNATLAPSLTHSPGGTLNPEIDFSTTPLRVQADAAPWTSDTPRRAAISAFGAGGSNAHFVVEEGPAAPVIAALGGPQLIVLSAMTEERLGAYAALLLSYLERETPALSSLAHTLRTGREPMPARLAFVAADLTEVRVRLEDYLAGRRDGLLTGLVDRRRTPGQASGDLEALARAFVDGDELEGAAAFAGAAPARLRLPGYPLERQRYWVTPPVAETGAGKPLHPLLDANVSTLERVAFARRFATDDPWVDDHRFQGLRLLPGVAGLEMARAAAAMAGASLPSAVRDVAWLRPLEVHAATDARLVLTPNATGAGFELVSERGGQTVQHARGAVVFDAPQDARSVDLANLRARCTTAIPADTNYAALDAAGLYYGPTFRTVAELWTGGGEVLARLARPAGGDELVLHPGLLDGALQTIAALPANGEGPALPFAVEEVRWSGPLPAAVYAHTRRRPGAPKIIDIDLITAEGRVCASLRGVVVREVQAPAPEITTSSPPPAETSSAPLMAFLREVMARELRLPTGQPGDDEDFQQYGPQSVQVMDMTDALEARLGPLPKTLFFEHHTVRELADYLMASHGEAVKAAALTSAPPKPAIAERATPPAALVRTMPVDAPPAQPDAGDIAVIGLAGRYPLAQDLMQFWDNLRSGRDCIRRTPPGRWDAEALGVSDWGGFLDDIDRFDAMFFRIAPREAELLDPQERLFLETAWQGLENAALTRDQVSGARVGVYVGMMNGLYQLHGPAQQPGSRSPGSGYWSVANRVSTFFNLRGPSMAVDTACSASLSALHMACAALRTGEADLAIAGGVNIASHPQKYLQLSQMKFAASDGRCRSFGEGGDGYVAGEGVGVAILKPLARALADGDPMWGVIKGSALNHGGRTSGYTVPNPIAQGEAISEALARSGVDPATLDYVEAHGTGTSLGDPIEIAGLNRALAGRAAGSCPIGSVKSNIGHLESAAGIAGLSKVLLQMRHGEIAPSLHAASLNPNIAFAASPCVVQRELTPWPTPPGRRLRAGLSSFGAGGSNAHLILEDGPRQAQRAPPQAPVLIVLSAHSDDRLKARAADLAQWLDASGTQDLDAVAYTLQVGREAMDERLALVATEAGDLIRRLKAFAEQGDAGDWSWRGSAGDALPNDPARRAELARMLVGQSALDEMGRHWAAGLDLPWAEHYPQGAPPRLNLPGYRFFGARHWLPDGPPGGGPRRDPRARIGADRAPPMFTPEWTPAPAGAVEAAITWIDADALTDVDLNGASEPLRLLYHAAGRTDPIAPLLGLLRRLAGRPRPTAADLVCLIGETPRQVALAGMLRAAVLEIPRLRAATVIGDPTKAAAEFASLAASVSEVRYREHRREIRTWREVTSNNRADLKPGGTWLITGGAGGLGVVFARALAAGLGAKLALVGRSAPDARIAALLDELKGLGGEAIYLAGDVGLSADAQRIVDATRAKFGPIHGVLHSAGVIRDALLARKTDADIAAVLSPKLDGTENLDAVTADDPLEAFALFSSLAAVAGNIGQTDYACANRFLGAFAEVREGLRARGARSGRTVAIDWPYWRDGGMQLDARALAGMSRAGLAPLDADAGLAAFLAALHSDAAVVATAAGEIDAIRRLFGVVPAPLAVLAPSTDGVRDKVRALAAAILKAPAEEIDDDESFLDYGFDSVSLAELGSALADAFGAPVGPALFFEHSSIAAVARHLEAAHGVVAAAPVTAAAPTPRLSAPSPRNAAPRDAVAVIGMSGVMPQSPDLETFWTNLLSGRALTGEVPAERWTAAGHWGGFIADADKFDPRFFGISAHEAARMDPQQRLFMQAVWGALEDAACPPSSLAGSNTALFVGVAAADYNELVRDHGEPITALTATGMAHSILANRISHLLDLRGPSEPVDTACSASLVAIDRAVNALRSGASDLAIAGGVNLLLSPTLFTSFQHAGMLSPTGRCRPFDASADGYVRGEGLGVLILKRLDDALADGDAIHAVIRGSATGHGGRSASLTAPSPEGQAAVLRAAWTAAGIDPATLGYIEAHGTGTPLGDPVELNGILKAFGADRPAACGVGSVKAAIGHLETAAGIAGVLKTILALRHETLPPTAELRTLNPELPQDRDGLFLVSAPTPWTTLRDAAGADLPRRAGVSSFGFGGVNAHLVLEEAPKARLTPGARGPHLAVLSAKTEAALRARAEDLRAALTRPDAPPLADVCHTLQLGRDAYAFRWAAVVTSTEALVEVLDGWLAGAPDNSRWLSGRAAKNQPAAAATTSLTEAARLWIAGGDVDWRARADRPGGAKTRLPTYPFAKERYWLPGAAKTTTAAPQAVHAPEPGAINQGALRAKLRQLLAEVSGFPLEQVEPEMPFEELGFDSLMAKVLHARLEEMAGPLPPSLPFECNTLDALARHLSDHHADAFARPATAPRAAAPVVVREVQRADTHEPIAIIGIAGRYPQAPTLDRFWENLRSGRDCVTEVPADRWDWRAYWSDDPQDAEAGRIYGKWGAFLEDADRFDPLFFHLAPAEAELMDPQERLFLETVWSAMEDAGYPVAKPPGGRQRRVGVFAGVTTLSHALWGPEQWKRGRMVSPAANPWSVANRVSYLFDFAGPSLPVDTACSASLTAIHMACESLRRGECEMAVAGGVNLYTHPAKYLALSQMRMLSPTGRCHAFGAGADGFVPGEGVGAVLLKPLSRAQADGDHIHAVIRGTAVNHSGKTNGYTVPSPAAQAQVIGAALEAAKVDPATISYVETHGTGTALGDPLEYDGLVRALGPAGAPCQIGSVKSNIGHLEAAAGIAGLTKLVLQLRHGEIAPSLHAQTVNPAIDLGRSRLDIARGGAWAQDNGPRRGALSSFGAGGANAHLIVEEYQPPVMERPADQTQLILLSARDETALRARARALVARIALEPELQLADVAFTLRVGRDQMAERLALTADDLAGVAATLETWLAGAAPTQGFWRGRAGRSDEIAALFDDDQDMAPLVEAWLARGRLDRLAAIWVRGAVIDWTGLSRETAVRRASLPAYPFSGDRFPLSQGGDPLWPLDGAAPAPQSRSLVRRIAADDPLLDHHRVAGAPILPGAAVLSLAAEAGAHLADVNWTAPIDVAAAANLHLTLTPDGGDQSFTVTARGAQHASGRLLAGLPRPAPSGAVASLVESLPQVMEAADFYARFTANGLDYGPAYRGVQRVHHDGAEALGVLELADAGEAAIAPPLLDAAFQVVSVLGLGDGAAGPALPACLDEMVVHRLPPARAFAHARVTGKGRFDITLYDGEDRACIELRGLLVRPLRKAAAGPSLDFCQVPRWRETRDAGLASTPALGRTLIVTPPDLAAFAAALAAQQPAGAATVMGLEGLKGSLPACDTLFILAGAAGLADAEAGLVRPLFDLLGGLARSEDHGPSRVIVVTDRLHAFEGAQPAAPWAAALPGMLRSAQRELPQRVLRSLDVDLTTSLEATARAVIDEARLTPAPGETEVLLRNGKRHAMKLEAAALDAANASPWRADGVYLIIGGAGGIGLALADHLLDLGARVALMGRRQESALAPEVRARLTVSSERLAYVQGDVADPASLEAALQAIEARFGPINGVVHSALVLRDRTLRNLSAEDIEAVFTAKTRGCVVLTDAMATRSPDFAMLFSSAQAILGSPGQANYAAASAFEDAFGAHWDRQAPYPVRVIDWGFWGEVGVVATDAYRERLAAQGIGSITVAEGLAVIAHALTGPHLRLTPLKADRDVLAGLGLLTEELETRVLPAEIPSLISRLMATAEDA